MKKVFIIFFCLLVVSCQRSSNQTWEDVKTAKNYFTKAVSSLFGKDENGAVVEKEEDFFGSQDEYIPLNDEDLNVASKGKYTSSKNTVPISKFQSPSQDISSIFKNLHFATDDHVLKDQKDLIIIQNISQYLKKHKNICLSIEGHCDERASAKYNMALGSRRANHIKTLLIRKGIDCGRLNTVSYGKEKPISFGHNPQDWKVNRRVEFKIFKK